MMSDNDVSPWTCPPCPWKCLALAWAGSPQQWSWPWVLCPSLMTFDLMSDLELDWDYSYRTGTQMGQVSSQYPVLRYVSSLNRQLTCHSYLCQELLQHTHSIYQCQSSAVMLQDPLQCQLLIGAQPMVLMATYSPIGTHPKTWPHHFQY